MPDLVDQDQDDESVAEEEEDVEVEVENQDELENILQQDSDSSVDKAVRDLEEIAIQEIGNAIRRSNRTTARVKRYDESYEWNLMNLSVNTALRDFGKVAD
jgi:superfamily II helicase